MKKFTLLLLGPAGSGKSTFVAGLSKIDISKYVAAETFGGANTTKVPTTYEFTNNNDDFNVIDCVCEQPENQEEMLAELKDICTKENGIEEIFNRIKDSEFAKKCSSMTIQLPCKEGLIPEDCIFDSIAIRDSRGMGDIDDKSDINIDELGITYDVNAILFFSITQIQQPAIFSKIIDSVLQVNLRTPIFSMRRYPKLTKNDMDFEEKILNNIKSNDHDLFDCIINLGDAEKEYRINSFVFNLPDVEQWAGVLDFDTNAKDEQIEKYTDATKEFLSYSIIMYEKLHGILVDKMQGQYQEKFKKLILAQLKSATVLDIAANITRYPHSKPRHTYPMNRDTVALSKPVVLSSGITEQPFRSEKSAAGNRYKVGVIPSYSYSCVNFRNIFNSIVNKLLTNEYSLSPLFCTFMDIVLEEYTTTASTGYQQQIRTQNAFKFDFFLSARDMCTKILKKNNLSDDNNVWSNFSYLKKYHSDEAIAVFVFSTLIDLLDIMNAELSLDEAGKKFVENYKDDAIFEQMKRN